MKNVFYNFKDMLNTENAMEVYHKSEVSQGLINKVMKQKKRYLSIDEERDNVKTACIKNEGFYRLCWTWLNYYFYYLDQSHKGFIELKCWLQW